MTFNSAFNSDTRLDWLEGDHSELEKRVHNLESVLWELVTMESGPSLQEDLETVLRKHNVS